MTDTPLPLKSVVLFIACGALVFIIVFLFAKRQITRNSPKSGRAPHVNIGSNAPKSLRQEIERRVNRVPDIQYDPRLMSEEVEQQLVASGNQESYQFFYRMKAVDSLALLDDELTKYKSHISRKATQSLRAFLIEQRQTGPLEGIKLDLIERFADSFDHARHDPIEFKVEQYNEHVYLLNQLIEHIRNKKNNTGKAAPPSILTNTPDLIESAEASTPQLAPKNTNKNNSGTPTTTDQGTSPIHQGGTTSAMLVVEDSQTGGSSVEELMLVEEDDKEGDREEGEVSQVKYRPQTRGAGVGRVRMMRQDSSQRSSMESNISNVSIAGSETSHASAEHKVESVV